MRTDDRPVRDERGKFGSRYSRPYVPVSGVRFEGQYDDRCGDESGPATVSERKARIDELAELYSIERGSA